MRSLTTEEFVQRAINIHGIKYDYSKTIYTPNGKFNIGCPKHGYILIDAATHLHGSGCTKCGYETIGVKRSLSKEQFLEKANLKYGSLYSYDLSNFVNGRSIIKFTCRQHGTFECVANRHLDRRDCPVCKKNNTFIKGYGRSGYRKVTEGKQSFVYLVKMSDDNETFYKIGIALDIRNRFRKRRKDYNIEIISVKIFDDGGLTYDKEVELHKKCKDFKYQPLKKFSGNTECYKFDSEVLKIFNQS